jgi:hypothetical protein
MRLIDFGKALFILFLFVLAAWSASLWPPIDKVLNPIIDGVIDAEEYQTFQVLGDVGVYLYNDEVYVYIGLSSPGFGWVAIGFSPVDVHKGANFLFGSVVDGETRVSDQFGSDQYRHEPDISHGGTNDIVEFAGREEAGTVIEFKIKMNTGDPYDTLLESGISFPCIIAYHDTDDDFQKKHTTKSEHIIILK